MKVLQSAAANRKVAIRIASATIEGKIQVVVRGRIEAEMNSEYRNADIYVVVALDHAELQVSGGENHRADFRISLLSWKLQKRKLGRLLAASANDATYQPLALCSLWLLDARLTFAACGPFGPSTISNSIKFPSSRVR
jgi:hypothetical protein